jgi:hypothetical protein
MFNLAAGTDWLVNVIRTTIFPPMAKFILSIDAVKKKFFPLISQIGINYRESSLSAHETDEDFEVKAGDRMPYFLVDGKSIYDKLRAPKFHLLSFTVEEKDHLRDHERRPVELDGNDTQLIDRSFMPLSRQVAELFGSNKPFNVLLRPDNHIALVSLDVSSSRVSAYLRDVVGMQSKSPDRDDRSTSLRWQAY